MCILDFFFANLHNFGISHIDNDDDELEFNNSDASVSEDSKVEDEEEVLVKEEPAEEDARI